MKNSDNHLRPPRLSGHPRLAALLPMTFLESFGTILLERGLYFYTHELYAFSGPQNLGLAFGFGTTYMLGAAVSHTLSHRFGERRVLLLTLFSLLALHALLTAVQPAALVATVFVVTGALHGIKWPIVESYVTAGQTPRQMLRTITRFNISWALAVPLAVAIVGPMLKSGWPPILFLTTAALNATALWLVWPLRSRPVHLDVTHPERPNQAEVARLASLLVSVRWSMLGGYALLFLLAPLMPAIFERLGQGPTGATVSSSLVDLVRVASFVILGWATAWQGRVWPLLAVPVALPLGFFMLLFAPNLYAALAGEAVFGAAAGLAYFAALYYAILVKNASVEAGGAHEGLIGLGFAIGPLLGLSGYATAHLTGDYERGMIIGVLPLLLVCAVGAVRPLLKLRRATAA